MHVAGLVPEDAPDPMLGVVEHLRRMPIPILGFVPQRHLEDWGNFGVQSGVVNGVLDEMTASISYTLWRHPDDPANPGNLADLDELTRTALEQEPAWPRPQWMLEGINRMRYRALPDAVRTAWSRDRSRQDVRSAVVGHVNHILVNEFGGAYPSSPLNRPGSHPLVDERCAKSGHAILVDGIETDGVRIDTDPDVVGFGADLGAEGLLTAVVPRDDLPLIEIAFATRPLSRRSPE